MFPLKLQPAATSMTIDSLQRGANHRCKNNDHCRELSRVSVAAPRRGDRGLLSRDHLNASSLGTSLGTVCWKHFSFRKVLAAWQPPLSLSGRRYMVARRGLWHILGVLLSVSWLGALEGKKSVLGVIRKKKKRAMQSIKPGTLSATWILKTRVF